jgi:hypothetical protein
MQVPSIPSAAGALGAALPATAADRESQAVLDAGRQRQSAPGQPTVEATTEVEAGHGSEDRGGNGQEPWQRNKPSRSDPPSPGETDESIRPPRAALTDGGRLLDLDA